MPPPLLLLVVGGDADDVDAWYTALMCVLLGDGVEYGGDTYPSSSGGSLVVSGGAPPYGSTPLLLP